MATANYVLLERITVGASGASSVTFNNIPQTGYTDLKVVMSGRITGYSGTTYDYLGITFNSDATSSYNNIVLYGNGSSAGSFSVSPTTSIRQAVTMPSDAATANTFGNSEMYIPNYLGSAYKSVSTDSVSENNGTTTYGTLASGVWNKTTAINAVTFVPLQGTKFTQYSTFSLYALAAVGTTPVIAPYASGGDIIQTDGTYWYHAFINSGFFTPNKALSCDVLVVAGGGGGGAYGGGGGAGGGSSITGGNGGSGVIIVRYAI